MMAAVEQKKKTAIWNRPITGKSLVVFVLFFTVVMEALIAEVHFPESIRYINDLFVFILFLVMIAKPKRTIRRTCCRVLLWLTFFIVLAFTMSAAIRGVTPILYLWAIRNTFRGFVFFYACITFLDREDLPDIFDKLFVLQVVNLLLALYQHFALGLVRDSVGGIFGHGNGAGVNTFNALIVAYYLNRYIEGKEPAWKLIAVSVSAMIIAALAEEKASYLYLLIVFCIGLIFTKMNARAAVALLVAVIAGCIGIGLIQSLFPEVIDQMGSFDAIDGYLTATYADGYVIPRIGAFKYITNMFFQNDPIGLLLGVGFGNGETSSFASLNGPFYLMYGWMHYRWFTHQWVFVECGWIGFISYLSFFVALGIWLLKERFVADDNQAKPYLVMGIALTIITIISIWYNATLKVDMCYLAFFSLSIGIVSLNTREAGVTQHV
jgi:hypothetical protein